MRRLFLLILVLMLIPVSLAWGDYIHPGEVVVETDNLPPETDLNSESGIYQYRVSWQGIPVARAEVKVRENSGADRELRTEVTAKTAKAIDLFYRLRHRSESVLSLDPLKPKSFVSHQRENSREKIRKIEFHDSGKISVSSKKLVSGRPKNDSSFEFDSDNFTLDPIAGALIAKSVPLKVGAEHSFDIFNGKHRYLITFKVVGHDDLRIGTKTYSAVKVVPYTKRLTDTQEDRRLKSATLWVSNDERRILLKLESKVKVGRIRAVFEGYQPLPGETPELIRQASYTKAQ